MDSKTIHDLAVAYAQAKLMKLQSDAEYHSDFTNEELKTFLKSYHFASTHLPEEDNDLDLSTLY